jgi:hypothetical protein
LDPGWEGALQEKLQSSLDRGGKGPTKRTAVDVVDPRPHKHHMLPVWFFIGLILLIYGVIICGTGIYELSHPPVTVLANLHAPIWWGAIMVAAGASQVNKYRPGKIRP